MGSPSLTRSSLSFVGFQSTGWLTALHSPDHSIVSSESVKGKVDVWSSEGLGTEIKVSFSAEPGREVTRGDLLTGDGDGVGHGLSVSLISFFEEHRGLRLAQDVLESYLEDFGFEIRDENEPGWADILLINEDNSVIDLFTGQRNTSRPIILYASSRGSGPQSESVSAYIAAGGFALVLTKPTGPIKLEAAGKVIPYLVVSLSVSNPLPLHSSQSNPASTSSPTAVVARLDLPPPALSAPTLDEASVARTRLSPVEPRVEPPRNPPSTPPPTL